MSEDKSAQEIIIVRRRGHEEDEHGSHGLWKIAYADFMTALMAFFLVMWLVNAANKKTLQQVATYFNPMRMSDQITSEKGLNDLSGQDKPSEGKGLKKTEDKEGSEEKKEEKPNPKISNVDEQGIFRDPYGLLAELSKKAATFRRGEENVPEGGSKNTISDVFNGGEGYRDPFDPDFRQEPAQAEDIPSDPPVADGSDSQREAEQKVAILKQSTSAEVAKAEAAKAAQEKAVADAKVAADAKAAADVQAAAAQAEAKAHAEAQVTPGPSGAESGQPGTAKSGEVAPGKTTGAQEPGASEKEEAKELEQAIRQMTAEAKTAIPNIEVTATSEGVMVSLTDDAKFGMFAVGSAKPRPELVAVMERLAGMLKDRPGEIVIRGHTDGRAYKSKDYDNWRLSTARAHMAYYMLLRGGIDEVRFDRIEGHADHQLKVAGEPNAAENRRIEILLKSVTP